MEQPKPDTPEPETPDSGGQGDEGNDQGQAPSNPTPSGGTNPSTGG
jgi:hypothetical protein